jgi:hypothetical protein
MNFHNSYLNLIKDLQMLNQDNGFDLLTFLYQAVPQAYPMDEDLIKLCIVNQLKKFGLGEYFVGEIEALLAQVYR